jgi:hypothetical protein
MIYRTKMLVQLRFVSVVGYASLKVHCRFVVCIPIRV